MTFAGARQTEHRARVRIAAVVCVLALACIAVGPARAADGASAYDRRVEAALEIIASNPARPDEATASRIANELDGLFPPAEEVPVAGGLVEVDNSILLSMVARLRSADSGSERTALLGDIETHLRSQARALPGDGGEIATDPEALDRLLFRQSAEDNSVFDRWIADAIEWFSRRIEAWMASLAANPGASTTISVVMWALLIALAAALVIVGTRAYLRARAGIAVPAGSENDSALPAVVPAAEGLPADALAHADRLAGAGRFREAVRALFGGAARALVEAGVVAQTRTRTNAELLAHVATSAAPAHGPLSELSGLFETAWYGRHDPGSRGYDAARQRYRDTLEALAGGGAA